MNQMSGYTVFVVVAFFTASFAALSKADLGDEHDVCMGHPFSDSESNAGWISDLALKDRVSKRVSSPIPRFQVNLDLAPEERWKAIGELYSNKTSALIDYIDSVIPKWLMPIVKGVGDDLDRYRGFRERGGEMKGYAKSLGVPLGYIAFANLFYQLEGIGINCTLRNETGPCPNSSSTSTDSVSYYKFPRSTRGPSGFCTSFVAQDPAGKIWHGRNMDWNLPTALRELYIDVEFARGGRPIFTATTVVGYVGIFNAVKDSKFSWSMDARDCGGNILENMLEMLTHGAYEPSQNDCNKLHSKNQNPRATRNVIFQYARDVMEQADSYSSAVELFSSNSLINPIYYIVAGSAAGEGAVVTRYREPEKTDVWSINASAVDGWFRLVTNYDHWEADPTYDDRRTPGDRSLRELGPKSLNPSSILSSVLIVWPVFNKHTDLTAIYNPSANFSQTMWWSD